MFSAVLGLFSQEVALDLGTSNTRLYLRGRGTGLQHPTVVAVHTSRGGRRRVMAIGDEARPMLGRTPSDILAVQPVRDGQIQDFEVMEALLLHMLRRVHGRNGWMSPRMVVTVPALATDMERRAVRECCEAAGAREVHLVPKPLAAALGAGLPVHEPAGQMVVDLGGGSTEIAVVSLNGVVTSQVVPGGGEGMDRALQDHVRAQHGLLIGRTTAEDLREGTLSILSFYHTDPQFQSQTKNCLNNPDARGTVDSAIRPALEGKPWAAERRALRTPALWGSKRSAGRVSRRGPKSISIVPTESVAWSPSWATLPPRINRKRSPTQLALVSVTTMGSAWALASTS